MESQPSTSSGVERDNDGQPYVKRRLYAAEVLALWNIGMLLRNLGTREQCVAFSVEQGLIPATKMWAHRVPMRIDYSTNQIAGSFVCSKGKCRGTSKVTRSKGTWFEFAKITMTQVYYLMYANAHRFSYEMAIREDFSCEKRLSTATVCDWYNYCREVVVLYQLNKQELQGKIGGPGKIVQIDESKFGKRKYYKGRHIEGHWVLGLIEDGSEDLRLEVCPDNIRSADVLVPLIQKHVEIGTTIHTDFWRAYDCLSEYGYIHKKVNHSDPDKPFVADDGTHTQRIESQWRVVKRFFMKDNYYHCNNFADLIIEYLWRRNVQRDKKDPFVDIIAAVKHTYKC